VRSSMPDPLYPLFFHWWIFTPPCRLHWVELLLSTCHLLPMHESYGKQARCACIVLCCFLFNDCAV
jgi:hypothetical protein